MAVQDFTSGWTETDPNGRLSQSSSRSTFTNLARNEDCWLWRSATVAGDFEVWYDVNLSDNVGGVTALIGFCSVNTEDVSDVVGAGQFACGIFCNTASDFMLFDCDGTLDQTNGPQNFTQGTTYFHKLVRTEGSPNNLILTAYPTSADRTANTNGTSYTHALNGARDYSYVLCPWSYNDANVNNHSGYIENLEFVSGVTVDESPAALTPSVSDATTVTESVSLAIGTGYQLGDFVARLTAIYEINVNDGTSISDEPSGQAELAGIIESDNIQVIDVATIEGPEDHASVAQNVAISESATIWFIHEPTVSDSVSASDAITMTMDDLRVIVTDNVGVIDEPTMEVGMESPITIGEWFDAEFEGIEVTTGFLVRLRGKFRYI